MRRSFVHCSLFLLRRCCPVRLSAQPRFDCDYARNLSKDVVPIRYRLSLDLIRPKTFFGIAAIATDASAHGFAFMLTVDRRQRRSHRNEVIPGRSLQPAQRRKLGSFGTEYR